MDPHQLAQIIGNPDDGPQFWPDEEAPTNRPWTAHRFDHIDTVRVAPGLHIQRVRTVIRSAAPFTTNTNTNTKENSK